MLAFPLGGYVAMMDFKYGLFLLICGGYCAAVIIIRAQLALTGIQPIEKIGKLVRYTPAPVKLLCLFLFFTILSSVVSRYNGTFIGVFRREGVLTISIYILSCVFLSKYFRPQKWILYMLGISISLFCVISVTQLTGANPFVLYPEGYNYYGADVYYPGRYLGTIGNVGLGAAFLCVAIGIFAMSLIKFDSKERWFLAAPLFLAVFLMFTMRVDAGIVALAVGLLLMLPVAVTNRKTLSRALFVLAIVVAAYAISQAIAFNDGYIAFRPERLIILAAAGAAAFLAVIVSRIGIFEKIPARWYRIGLIAVVLSVICLGLLYLWFFGGGHSGMIFEASEVLRGRWDDEFGTKRVYIWRNVLSGISPRNLILGTGPDTLGYWDIEPFTRYSEELGMVLTSRIDTAHNEYMQTLATTGFLSLLCYLGALLYTFVSWFRFPENKLSAVAGAGVLLYCIQAFFGISMCLTAPFFWAGFGCLIYSINAKNGNVK
jgi:O-antigen ligase